MDAELFSIPESEVVKIFATAGVIAVLIYLLPFLLYPFNLLFTMIHEIGHVFAGRLSGAIIKYFKVFTNDSGETFPERNTGDPYLMLPAGYVGRSLVAALLILLTGLPQYAPYSLGLLGGLLILFVLLYGSQAPKNGQKAVTHIIGLGFGVLMIAVAWLLPPAWSLFVLYLLAIQGFFISLNRFNRLYKHIKDKEEIDDASQMEAVSGCPAVVWAWSWYFISLFALGAAVWFTWLRPWLRQ